MADPQIAPLQAAPLQVSLEFTAKAKAFLEKYDVTPGGMSFNFPIFDPRPGDEIAFKAPDGTRVYLKVKRRAYVIDSEQPGMVYMLDRSDPLD